VCRVFDRETNILAHKKAISLNSLFKGDVAKPRETAETRLVKYNDTLHTFSLLIVAANKSLLRKEMYDASMMLHGLALPYWFVMYCS